MGGLTFGFGVFRACAADVDLFLLYAVVSVGDERAWIDGVGVVDAFAYRPALDNLLAHDCGMEI